MSICHLRAKISKIFFIKSINRRTTLHSVKIKVSKRYSKVYIDVSLVLTKLNYIKSGLKNLHLF